MMVAKKFASPGKRKMHFAVSDAGNFSAELNDLGLSYVNDTPVVVARDLSERRYVMQQPLTVDNLEQFTQYVLIGKHHPHVRSAPVPQTNDGLLKVLSLWAIDKERLHEGEVCQAECGQKQTRVWGFSICERPQRSIISRLQKLIVVGTTFDDVVNDATKDVLIFFHSSWCEECPGVNKKLQKLAKKLKNNDRILLTAIDGIVNDVPKQYVMKRFPSVFFAAKKSKMSPKLYEGKYEVEDIMKFIAKEASEPLWQDIDKTGEITDVKTEL